MQRSLCFWILTIAAAHGLIFRDGPSPAANTETAPTGAYANSGWEHQVQFVTSHGTIISPKHFITARHLGSGGALGRTVKQPVFFGVPEERVYAVKGSRELIGTTDLAIFEIWETFDDYAELYEGTSEVGKEMVIHGSGRGRGEEVAGKGWKWGAASTRKSRWGRNTLDGIVSSDGNEFLYFDFDDVFGQDEAMAMVSDSGGGWFVKDGSVWKLVAVTYSVDARHSDATSPSNANSFRGGFYEAGGLHIGSDATGWQLIPTTGSSDDPDDIEFYRQSHTYGSRISSDASAIKAIIDPAIEWQGKTFGQRFEGWLSEFGITGETGAGDDPDGDGIPNLNEYLVESDPNQTNDFVRPLQVAFLPDGSHRFTFVESLDLAGRGITTVLENSTDLANWEEVIGQVEESIVRDDPNGVQTRTTSIGPIGAGKRFYRLKVTLSSSS